MTIIVPPSTNLTDLPPVPEGLSGELSTLLNRMRESLQVLRANRGDPMDAAITWRGLIANGLAQMSFVGLGGEGGTIVPPNNPGDEPDLTPPPTVTGLGVFAGISKILVQWDAATYAQGHGNRQTNIYAVQRDPASTAPAPTFGDAALVSSGTQPLTIIDISSNPNTKWFVWAKYESVDGVESTAPAGGTNGVQATTGQDVTDLLDSLNQAALDPNSPYAKVSFRADLFFITPTANFYQDTTPTATAVGDLWFKPSTGVTYRWDGSAWVVFPVNLPFFVTTVPITQNGVTCPPGVYIQDAFIANGTITNAMIGNAVIDNAKISDLSASKLTAGSIAVGEFIDSPNYVPGSAGWKISGSGFAEFSDVTVRGAVYASSGTFAGSLTAATGTLGALTLASTGNIKAGQTAYNTGTGFWLGLVSGTPKFSIGDPAGHFMVWDGTNLNVNGNFEGVMTQAPFTASITGGDLTVSVSNGAQTYGSRTAAVSGGVAPYDYLWAVTYQTTDNTNPVGNPVHFSGSNTTATCGFSGDATDNILLAGIVVFVTDANGRTAKATMSVSATHGTPP